MEARELTRAERAAIRKLVTGMCANYDSEYGCLPLDGDCYMLGKYWTGAYCKYFRDAILPLDPVLEATLTETVRQEIKHCAICGEIFASTGKRAYCSADCAGRAQRRQQREHMRKKRSGC